MEELPVESGEEGVLLGCLVAPFIVPFLKAALIALCLYAALSLFGIW
jgi:hypothetical protein